MLVLSAGTRKYTVRPMFFVPPLPVFCVPLPRARPSTTATVTGPSSRQHRRQLKAQNDTLRRALCRNNRAGIVPFVRIMKREQRELEKREQLEREQREREQQERERRVQLEREQLEREKKRQERDRRRVKVCLACGKSGRRLKKCSGCQKVYLCNADCQKAAWPRHRADCVPRDRLTV